MSRSKKVPGRLRRNRDLQFGDMPAWGIPSENILVHTYDARVVKSWARGMLATMTSEHPDPRQAAFDAELARFLGLVVADEDEHVAMAIGFGRIAERKAGEEPIQMEPADDPALRERAGKVGR